MDKLALTEKEILHALAEYIDLDLIDDIQDIKVLVRFLSWMLGYPVDEVRERLSKEKNSEDDM